jgi:hypothetical protein
MEEKENFENLNPGDLESVLEQADTKKLPRSEPAEKISEGEVESKQIGTGMSKINISKTSKSRIYQKRNQLQVK